MLTYESIRLNPSLLEPYKQKEILQIGCSYCKCTIERSKKRLQKAIWAGYSGAFCSRQCESGNHSTDRSCGNCGVPIRVHNCELMAVNFCSRSCAASVNNRKKPPRSVESRVRQGEKYREHLKVIGALGNARSADAHKARRILKVCSECSFEFTVGPRSQKKYCSRPCAVSNMGGIREGSGRSKAGTYQNIFCQSSYEFAFVYLCLHEGRDVIRNTEGFPYRDEAGKLRRYFPDFIVDGAFHEVKGFLRDRDAHKFAAFPHPLTVLDRERMKPILATVEELTGVKRDKFHTLYAYGSLP